MILYRNIICSYKKNHFINPNKSQTSKILTITLIALLSFSLIKNQAYSAPVQPENPSWSYSIKKCAVPILTQTLFSIDKLQTQSPLLSWALKSSLLKVFQAASRVSKTYVLTYEDIKTFNDYAKSTRYGYYDLSFRGKKIYFIANEDLANKVIALEGQEINNITNRRLLTPENWFLLEHNPVAARDMRHHAYGRKQAVFFHHAFERLQQLPDLSVLLTDNITSGYLYGDRAEDQISNLLTQIYFQILFSNPSPEYPVNRNIQQHVGENYRQINSLYDQLEEHTGKYNLNSNNFIHGNKPFPKVQPYSNIRTLEQFYKVLCLLYDIDPLLDDVQNSHPQLTRREALALKTVGLLKTNNAAVLPVFTPSLTQDIENISPEEAVNIVFNLLSWIDNSLNISNTATNFVIHVAEQHKENQHLVNMGKLFVDEVHNLRALATLFPRKVNQPFLVTTTTNTGEHHILFKTGDKILITNSLKGHAFGYEPRKCPSRPYSTYILPQFLHYLFQHYHARYDTHPKLSPDTASWFWNKLDVRPLVLEPRLTISGAAMQ